MLTYSVQASPAAADVAQRNLSVSINGAAATVGPLSAGFTCAVGDQVALTLTDVSAAGVSSPPSSPYSFTATDTLAAPSTPSILGVTLVSDASPAPAPAS